MLPAAHASPGWRHALCGFPLLPAPTLSSPAHSCLILRPVCRTFPRTHPAPRPEGALPQPFFDENTFHNQRLRPFPSTPHHSACTTLSCPSACTTPSCPYHATRTSPHLASRRASHLSLSPLRLPAGCLPVVPLPSDSTASQTVFFQTLSERSCYFDCQGRCPLCMSRTAWPSPLHLMLPPCLPAMWPSAPLCTLTTFFYRL